MVTFISKSNVSVDTSVYYLFKCKLSYVRGDKTYYACWYLDISVFIHAKYNVRYDKQNLDIKTKMEHVVLYLKYEQPVI